jgi:plastocyanin
MRRGQARRRAVGATLLAACLGAFATSPLVAADAETEVYIDNFAFSPEALTVKAGTVVAFRNRDDIPHSVVGVNQEFHSKALDTDDTFSFTFAKPGTYNYFCGLHPKMTGEIIVTP